MKQRCLNKNNSGWHRYGGRGISVCRSWLKFENFYRDMGTRPVGTSLHRIDNDKGYFKNNCKWATIAEQSIGKSKGPLRSTKKYRGVNRLPSGNFAVRIMNTHVGTFSSDKEAAIVFNAIAKKLYGKNACLNAVNASKELYCKYLKTGKKYASLLGEI